MATMGVGSCPTPRPRDAPWAIEAATEDALDSADEPPARDLSA